MQYTQTPYIIETPTQNYIFCSTLLSDNCQPPLSLYFHHHHHHQFYWPIPSLHRLLDVPYSFSKVFYCHFIFMAILIHQPSWQPPFSQCSTPQNFPANWSQLVFRIREVPRLALLTETILVFLTRSIKCSKITANYATTASFYITSIS